MRKRNPAEQEAEKSMRMGSAEREGCLKDTQFAGRLYMYLVVEELAQVPQES